MSFTVTITGRCVSSEYRCEPVTANGPPIGPTTVPGVVVPSPQLIVAVKSVDGAPRFASWKLATVPENDCPSTGVIVTGASAFSGASPTEITETPCAVAPSGVGVVID